MKKILTFILTLLLAMSSIAVIFVDINATGLNNGTSWINAYTNLQNALTISNSEIWVAQGTYYPGVNRTNTFNPPSFVSIYGGFTNGMTNFNSRNWNLYPTILSGEIGDPTTNSDNIVHIMNLSSSSNNVIDGFNFINGMAMISPITSGNATNRGAAIYITGRSNSFVNIVNCNFSNNIALQEGGAISIFTTGNSTNGPMISNCYFYGNQSISNSGGALYADLDYKKIQILNSTFESNKINNVSSTYGGAFRTRRARLILSNCVFKNNIAAKVVNNQSAFRHDTIQLNAFTTNNIIANCIFYENKSAENTIYVDVNNSTNDIIENCLFYGNITTNTGRGTVELLEFRGIVRNCIISGNNNTRNAGSPNSAGLYIYAGHPRIENCIITGNRSYYNGGAIFLEQNASLDLKNCLVVGNQTMNGGAGIYIYEPGNINILNSTFAFNNVDSSAGLGSFIYINPSNIRINITNSIIWRNTVLNTNGSSISIASVNITNNFINISYSDLAGGLSNIYEYSKGNPTNYFIEGTNIYTDPLFPILDKGTWTSKVYNTAIGMTIFTDTNKNWNDNIFSGQFINPDITKALMYYIISNNSNSITILGNAITASNNTYNVYSFSPDSKSLVVDRGMSNGMPITDILGKTRYQGIGFDMGAYEVNMPLYVRTNIMGKVIVDRNNKIRGQWQRPQILNTDYLAYFPFEYALGTQLSYSPATNTLTNSLAPTVFDKNSLRFTGGNSYTNNSVDWYKWPQTITMWIKMPSSSQAPSGTVVSIMDTTTNSVYTMYIPSTTGGFIWEVYSNGNYNTKLAISNLSTVFPNDKWVSLALELGGNSSGVTNMALYTNAVLVSYTSSVSAYPLLSPTNNTRCPTFSLGYNHGQNNGIGGLGLGWVGHIDSLQLYNRLLSTNELDYLWRNDTNANGLMIQQFP